MKKFLIIFVIPLVLFSNSLNIYVLDSTKAKGLRLFKEYLKSLDKNSEAIIFDVNNGYIAYRGSMEELDSKLKRVYKKKPKEPKNNTPYILNSIYNTILPNKYSKINLYFFNSIFYKDSKYDFTKGRPNDSFLVSTASPFNGLKGFKEFPIKTYIFTNNKYFINKEHQDGIKRFYYLLSQKLSLNLQVFNSSFRTKQEKFNVVKLNKSINKPLAIVLTPPKKIHFSKDSISITHDKNSGSIKGYVSNYDRKNSNLTIYINEEPHTFDCDNEGICRFNIPLRLGKNIVKINKIDNSVFKQEFNSKFIPNDIIEYGRFKDIKDNVTFILKSKHTDRPVGSEVKLVYKEKNKTFKTKVDANGYYEFNIPLEYALNNFVLKEYNGNSVKIPVENEIIKRKEIEEARKKAIEAEKARKKREAEIKEKKRKAKEDAKKIAQAKKEEGAINSGVNKVINDKEILVNNYEKYDDAKKEYKLMLNTPQKVDYFSIDEYDADGDSFDVYLIDDKGNRKMIKSNIEGSGNNENIKHKIDNPYKDTLVKSIVIVPNDDLGGMWQIKNAFVKYKREN